MIRKILNVLPVIYRSIQKFKRGQRLPFENRIALQSHFAQSETLGISRAGDAVASSWFPIREIAGNRPGMTCSLMSGRRPDQGAIGGNA
ncbi:hypothetical protein ACWGTI_27235 [Mesorhizobium sp. ArgA1]